MEGGAIPAKAGTPGPLKIVGTTAAAGVCALAAAIFWLADPLFLKSPQDQQLLGKFHDSRAAFEVLHDRVIEDSHHKRYFRISNLDDVSDERRDRYQKLLTEISSGLIVTVDDYVTVRFIFAVGGLSAIGPGWSKGIEYVADSRSRGLEIVKDLDHLGKLPAGVYLRPIEDKWFILYQYID